ncbi:type II toxin-antitoxin system VapC family toxin [Burkholderia stagnalis]|uniref:Ribonuclease VapC n=1 Tax=Burkholderia stagnalis TaxID=1503054 RepID=A0ABX9YDH7_9BURK|nr:type II toxin-antitoxin system VapC family toxin [Burkholderia stagnalis]RQQ42573.1 type II toxin-antitoxin system VapC family toxin [Burkholderia stagnalis]RQQ77145.1 type II toxin-antitoxin system VapC family toxin [Burkholderia stagnalis]RQR00254.1 type II toxin-antitoxin system VapC family toxin [Burkholderia stagnalis]RQR00498.1 type II toxin-antitoxin system VapC family toxin [Burkholderia stagnalis]RQR09278.1 type II toxin-antitoxin system VapC family toxin [Burkholderia stagnalis]
MILVDTSVWIDHIDHSEPVMVDLLLNDRVRIHPYVIGEISLGSLRDRSIMLRALNDLPRVPVATPDEVFYLIEQQQLFNRGIGYVDASLLASAKLRSGVTIWTRDKRLKKIADELALSAALEH